MARSSQAEMPFLDHLEELRWRILWSLAALIVGVGVAFVIMLKIDVIRWLELPVLPFLHGRKLVYTHPGDPFSIVLTASIAIGVVLALPVITWQVWAFLSPALHRHEKRVAIPVLVFALLLFLGGVTLGYFFVLPLALEWLMSFQTAALEPMLTASEYFSFTVSLVVAFGAAFELPIVLLGLTALGVVTPRMLNHFRRHAIVACVVIGAFLTPGDMVWTTIAMSVPLYFLYEISVVLSYVVERRRRKRAERLAREAAEEDGGGPRGGPGSGVDDGPRRLGVIA
jgi:sec-independent protein translocase protein TatC